MKKLKHLYPAMKNFVYPNGSKSESFERTLHRSLYQLLLIFGAIFVLSKLIILKMPLGYMELIWALISITVLLTGHLMVRKVKDPRINYQGFILLMDIALEIVGLYGMLGVLLPYYNTLYLGWIIMFFIVTTIVCTIAWVRHCIVWDRFSAHSTKKPRKVNGITTGGFIINVVLIGFGAHIGQTGGTWLIELALLFLSAFWIFFPLNSATIQAMKLYYYYKYLRTNRE